MLSKLRARFCRLKEAHRKSFTFQIKLEQKEREEDRVRLEGQFKANMEAQRKLMEDMRKDNLNTIESMKEVVNKKDDQIEELIATNTKSSCSLL